MSTAFGTKIPGQLVTSAWANLVGSSINALEDGNAMSLSQILAKYTGTPNGTKFLRDDGSWQNATTTDASALTSGTLPLARLSGITTTELSASAGIVSGQIAGVALDKLTAGTLGTGLTFSTGAKQVSVGGTNVFAIFSSGIYGGTTSGGSGSHLLLSGNAADNKGYVALHAGPADLTHGAVCKLWGHAFGGSNDGGIDLYPTQSGSYGPLVRIYSPIGNVAVTIGASTGNSFNVESGLKHSFTFAGTEKYRFSSALCEFNRLSLGGTIGSSVDPGAGGMALTGPLLPAGKIRFTAATTLASTDLGWACTYAPAGVPTYAKFNVPTNGATFWTVAGSVTPTAGIGYAGGEVGASYAFLGQYGYANAIASPGISVSSTVVKYNSATGTNHDFMVGGTSQLTIQPTTIYAKVLLQMADGINISAQTTTGTKIGTSTAQKIAFWNSTPIVQPASTGTSATLAAAGGTNALYADSTSTGETGATAYSLPDVIKNLKAAGILAT